jgi:endonuclease/exonuclease/phosphatase (EEP) superfamily protein YafD
MKGRCVLVVLLPVFLAGGCRVATVHEVGEFDPAARVLPREFTLGNWNIEKAKDDVLSDDLNGLMTRHAPDLMFAQEVREDLPTQSGYGAVFAPAWRYPGANGAAVGVQTSSKVKPTRVTPLRSRKREPGRTTPKMALATEYPLEGGKTLLAVNVHCLNFQRFWTRKLRDQLGDIEAVIEAHSGPAVFAGDFNTWNGKRLTVLREMTSRLGMAEVDQFPPGRKTGGRKSAFMNGLMGIDSSLVLDRVFVRGLRVRDAEVLPYESSDHQAMRVWLRVLPEE